jgi:hypothetical protein
MDQSVNWATSKLYTYGPRPIGTLSEWWAY